MSKQFKVVKIFQLISPAAVVNEFVGNYSNTNAVDKIYSVDVEGDLFVLHNDLLNDPQTFKSKAKSPKVLFRDYWRCVQSHKDSPFTKSILKGQHRILFDLMK